MLKLLKITAASLLLLTATMMAAATGNDMTHKALVILSSGSAQTQGMALVLSNTMAGENVQVQLMLCDKAGDLALKNDGSSTLKPKGLTPGQMLRGLIKAGAKVQVCALYLPNSQYRAEDLLEGITVATPPSITQKMLDPNTRTFSF
jgi:predicted peroxiredoxin